jgi:hypothetical protein
VTLTTWVTTGKGELKNLSFLGVMSAPPVNSVRRAPPAIKGMSVRAIRPAGTIQRFRGAPRGPGRLFPAGLGVSVAAFLVAFTGTSIRWAFDGGRCGVAGVHRSSKGGHGPGGFKGVG